jgi:uncharacterized protein (TIGR02284 family)
MPTNVIAVLNDLAETSKDSERGFQQAAHDTRDQRLKLLFTSRANDCLQASRELQRLVERLGGRPEGHATVDGILHRRWIGMKSVVLGRDDRSILAECDRGEGAAEHRYRRALDAGLPADARLVVERQYLDLLQNHVRIRELRDQHAIAKS